MVGYAKGRVRREDIIAAAAAAYGESGYRQASLRDIARRVGISHSGLLYHFPTKEALLTAVLERRDAVDAARERLHGPPGAAVLRSMVSLAAHNTDHPAIVELYSRLAAEAVSPDHPAHGYFARHYRRARDLVRASFTAMAEAGELRDGVDPDRAATVFIALMDGLQVQWLTSPDEVDMTATLRTHLATLLRDGS
ncbi:TetR family transcriptional regulator [Stackebrandtia albiflava]|uniref:TetR family transcriptional regulator n=1 Tax=Stackebrandtia albiflava TaxID=406432 RepID=A0A562V4T9_9ACTN|nr:TetR/AcrR family transcriptional regulator [Stackebrandtia albiflava]TWJ12911.1 TetR family transcriptional regulator [Stackebrandtia albiflava]